MVAFLTMLHTYFRSIDSARPFVSSATEIPVCAHKLKLHHVG